MITQERIEFRLNNKGLFQHLFFLCLWIIIIFLPVTKYEITAAPLIIKMLWGTIAILYALLSLAIIIKPYVVINRKGLKFNLIKFSFAMDWDDIEGYELNQFEDLKNSSTYLSINRRGPGIMPTVGINLKNIKEPDRLLTILSERIGERNKSYHSWGDPNHKYVISQISEPPPVTRIDYKGYIFSHSGIEHEGKAIKWNQVRSVHYPDTITIGGMGSVEIIYIEEGINRGISLPASSNPKHRLVALSIVHYARNAFIHQSLVDAVK